MAIDYTAWPTPTEVYSLLTSAGIAPTLASGSDLAQLRIDAAVQELTKRTHRQFLPGEEGEVRYFDGTGTGAMEVDEYIDVTAIRFYTLPQYATINWVDYVQVERATFPKTRIQILQGPPNVPYGWWTTFPEGRSNIAITATWGYGETIPPDVWQAVLYKAAANVYDADRLNERGVYDSVKNDDVTLGMRKERPSEVSGWAQEFERVCKTYKRPLRRFLGRTKPRLI